VPRQAGNNHPTSIPTGVFEVADGYINIAVAGQIIWERFCASLEGETFSTNPNYATAALRSDNRDALNAEINDITKHQDGAVWIEAFNKAGVPAGAINTIDQVFADPQVQHLEMAAAVESEALGSITLVAQAIKMNRTPSSLAVAPPERGEHTDEILGGLDFSADDIADLRRRNVI